MQDKVASQGITWDHWVQTYVAIANIYAWPRGSNPFKDVQIGQLLQLSDTLRICLYDLLVIEQDPVVPKLNMGNIMSRMHRRALV